MENHQRVEEVYIKPPKAYKKMKMAFNSLNPIYISGVTGYGKTVFVKNFLKQKKYTYISCSRGSFSCRPNENDKIIVIDDISFLSDENDKKYVLKMSGQNGLWLILVGRSRVPKWLVPVCVENSFVLIDETDLAFGVNELEKFFASCGRRVNSEDLEAIQKRTSGHPVLAKMFVMSFDKDIVYNEKVDSEIEKMFFEYLEQTVYQQWDRDVVEFLMRISIVDKFTIPLAEMIAAKSGVSALLEKATSIGNFIFEDKGEFRLANSIKNGMRLKLEREYTKQQKYELYYNAGLFYELHDKIPEALQMYEKCEKSNRISELLIKNAEKNPGSGSYYELRKYYLGLPEEYIKKEPKLMAGMSMLYSLLMQPEKSEQWYDCLKNFEKENKGALKAEAKSRLVYLDIGLPHRGIKNIAEIFAKLSALIMSDGIRLPEFSITSNLPSIMNGGKDFSKWTLYDNILAEKIGTTVERALGSSGIGLVNISLGESMFEKGGDSYDIMNRLNCGRMQAEANGKLEVCFAAIGTTARLNIVHGEIDSAIEVLTDFREKLYKEGAKQLLPNLDAFLCLAAMYKGDISAVDEWLLEAPKEGVEFFIMERFRYLVKIRAYIMKGNYNKAISLLQVMLYYSKLYYRGYIFIQAKLLLAVCLFRTGSDKWEEELREAIKSAEKYRFIRVISLEGCAVSDLIHKAHLDDIDKKYMNAVETETRDIAMEYPAYLKNGEIEKLAFSDNALKILRLQADGLSYKEISYRLGIKEDNVRYHIRENYKKLGVREKAEAVMEASRLKLI